MTQHVKFELLGTVTGTTSTHLLDVDGSIGAAWTPHPEYQGALYYHSALGTNTGGTYLGTHQIRDVTGPEEEALYVASGTPQESFNIRIPILTQTDTTARRMGLAYKVQDNKFKTFYLLRWGRSQLSLSLVNLGSETVLATVSDASAQGAEKLLQVSLDRGIHNVSIGAVTLTATDSSIVDAGRLGLWAEAGTTTGVNRIYTDFSGALLPTQAEIDNVSIISAVHEVGITLDPFVFSGTGSVGLGTNTGTIDITLQPFTLTGTGASSALPDGSIAIELEPFEFQATGVVGLGASVDATLPVPTSQISAVVGVGGTVGITLQPFRFEATGGGQYVDITLAPFQFSAEGVVGLAASINGIVPRPTASISASVAITGSMAITLEPFVVHAEGEPHRAGALVATLPAMRGQVSGDVGIVGNIDITLEPFLVQGTIVIPLTASLDARLPRLYGLLDAEYGGTTNWRVVAVNVQNGAVTEYSNFEFNSLTRFNGKTLAAGDNGIFSLEGETDDGADIDAAVTFPLGDAGSLNQKRPADAYGHYVSPKNMLLSVAAKGESFDYDLPQNDSDDVGEVEVHKAPLGKGFKSARHQFGVRNVEGADFEYAKLVVNLNDTGRQVR
jgi:hypothetical protein